VLDISRGEGGSGIPVTLSRQSSDGSWEPIAQTPTGANGRAEDFGDHDALNAGTYLLSFDMTAYDGSQSESFFPVITIVFVVAEDDGTYHVPVLVSPYGYSTYRGN
jgi:5-hydroxyisourate hydrolase